VASTAHPCRPCGHDGCGGSKVSDCLTSIVVDDVMAAAQEFLGA
jgi:heptosyltransferase-3